MERLFTNSCLSIGVSRSSNDKLRVDISSDFSGSSRKSQLYVNKDYVGEQFEKSWKSIKTKKLIEMRLSFGEIDWYDDMTDVYETPIVHIARGQKKVRFGTREHGSIPKDWSIDVTAYVSDTTTKTPIIEVVKKVLGSYFTSDMEKKFTKELKLVLQKKTQHCNLYNE